MLLESIKKIIDDAEKNHGVPCSDIVVTYKGEEVLRYMSTAQGCEPIKGDEQYFLYSATKPITCTAVLQLYEKGLIGLDDYLYKYIPEYKDMYVKTETGIKKAENHITIRHLMTMTAGLNYNLGSDSIKKQIEEKPDSSTQDVIKALANEPLEFEPGTHYLYSLCHDVLAAVIEVVSGMSYGEYLKKNIFDVCGMKNTYSAKRYDDRVYTQYRYVNGKPEIMEKKDEYVLCENYQSGGAGLVSCVDDYIKFASAMANTELLLKRETIDLMRTPQLCEAADNDFKKWKPHYSYGLGVRTNVDNGVSPKGEFGWDGAACAYTLIDPDSRIALFYATHIRNHSDYMYMDFHMQLRDAVYNNLNN